MQWMKKKRDEMEYAKIKLPELMAHPGFKEWRAMDNASADFKVLLFKMLGVDLTGRLWMGQVRWCYGLIELSVVLLVFMMLSAYATPVPFTCTVAINIS